MTGSETHTPDMYTTFAIRFVYTCCFAFGSFGNEINLHEFGGRPDKSCALLVWGIAALVMRKLEFDVR